MSDDTPDALELLDGHHATVTNGGRDVYIYDGEEHLIAVEFWDTPSFVSTYDKDECSFEDVVRKFAEEPDWEVRWTASGYDVGTGDL